MPFQWGIRNNHHLVGAFVIVTRQACLLSFCSMFRGTPRYLSPFLSIIDSAALHNERPRAAVVNSTTRPFSRAFIRKGINNEEIIEIK